MNEGGKQLSDEGRLGGAKVWTGEHRHPGIRGVSHAVRTWSPQHTPLVLLASIPGPLHSTTSHAQFTTLSPSALHQSEAPPPPIAPPHRQTRCRLLLQLTMICLPTFLQHTMIPLQPTTTSLPHHHTTPKWLPSPSIFLELGISSKTGFSNCLL
jgi:hypothetical protein